MKRAILDPEVWASAVFVVAFVVGSPTVMMVSALVWFCLALARKVRTRAGR